MHAAPVTGPDEQIGVASHEVLSHADLNSVGKKTIGVGLERLDIAENVIPSTAVQTNGVIPQFIENLIHLKHRRKSFNQDGGPDAPVRYSDHFLRRLKHPVPYPRFSVQLYITHIVRDI